MKSLSNNTATEFLLYDSIGGSSPKPRIKTEYYSDNLSTFVEFDTDIESRNIELSTENKRYAAYSFMPPVKSMSMVINNYGQSYSTGAGYPKASILKKNLIVRCWSGYELIDGLDNTSQVTDAFTATAKFYHTQKSGSSVILNIADFTGATIASAAEMGGTAMGVITYGTLTLGYPGYYTKTFRLSNEQDPVTMSVNVSSANFSFRYRLSQYADFSGAYWSDYQTLESGLNTITIPGLATDQYLQYICRFNASTWNTADAINSVAVNYEDTVALIKRGTFVIDEPIYSDKVNVVGRDYLKKALETEVNLPDLTESKRITVRMREVLDRCNIPYISADWETIATACEVANATIAESLADTSGWKICDLLMDAVNAGDDNIYFTFDEDGNAVVKKLETDVEADWVTHYLYNIESVSKSFDSDKQLQRCTVVNKDIVVNAEATLASFTGTTSGTSLHLTYGTTAMYVRYSDANSVITAETNRTNTGIDFSVNSGAAYDIEIYGCHPKSVAGGAIWAEAGNSDNILNNNGSTYKSTNPFMNAARAKAFVDYLIDINADPKYTMTVKQQVNPLLEVGLDNIMVFDKYTFTDNIYGLQSISESWNNPSLKETIKLRDRGFDLGVLIWDRNGYVPGVNDLKWDIGFVWDLDLGPNATGDTASYDGYEFKELQFRSA